ncbi:hypothetical protein BFP97_05160 [Roseivirga sp. 4D4]|uniref:hypothetical protein n=1 Tax=Roseivirga sp. 4D4 TaxID=1889784 RepID=UPI00085342DE|nr:hypothetical protein [Roseivirga sp. 4D4]OEK00933.1 hypothetical protein BFP97_05160 [Roseivirga sp. 4D4]
MSTRLIFTLCLLSFLLKDVSGQSNTTSENPNEQLAYLVGTWKLALEGFTAFMDFEWGPNRTYIFSRNRNIRDGVETIENSALIAWDGVEEKFVISSVYNDPGGLLVGRGFVEYKNGVIARDIELHYAEGQYAPFLKRTAPKGGLVMDYRQRWTKVDESSFEGVFEVKVNGEWIAPFKSKGVELWVKVK